MKIDHIQYLVFALPVLLLGCGSMSGSYQGLSSGNIITGEGIANPNPVVVNQWGDVPEGLTWGHTAGIDIDPTDGHVWAYERCGSGGGFMVGQGPVNCETNPVNPIYKFDPHTGEVLANFGANLMVTPHGIDVDDQGNVWVTDFANNQAQTKGQQVHKFSPEGELLMSLGVAGKRTTEGGLFNQPNDVVIAPDGSIFVSDGHTGQTLTSENAIEEGRAAGSTGRIMKFSPEGALLMEWGRIGTAHGEFRTPHGMDIDSQGRLWVADRGNHRLEIFDLEGNYLESRYSYGRISGIHITEDDMVYAIDSESGPINHVNWISGVRIGPLDEDRITGFVPGYPLESRGYQSTAGEGVAVDEDGNIFVAEGPSSINSAGGSFTKYMN